LSYLKVRLNLLVVDLAFVILACLVEDHAYLLEAYRDHPFLVVDPCLVVYSMDVLEEDLSYRLEAFLQVVLPYLVVVHRGLELLKVYHLASYFIFFPWLLLST
jgi:hypothetical protein